VVAGTVGVAGAATVGEGKTVVSVGLGSVAGEAAVAEASTATTGRGVAEGVGETGSGVAVASLFTMAGVTPGLLRLKGL
jgi:hypothetical protein